MNVRTLCLGILWLGEATGYEIRKQASEGCFSHFIVASYGSIYPALNKLTQEGLVTWRAETHEGKPARKVYALTDAGRAAFLEALHEAPGPDVIKSEFLFVGLFAEHLDRVFMGRIADQRVAELEAALARLADQLEDVEHSGSRFAIGYGMALYEAALAYVKENRHLIEPQAGSQRPRAAE
jgi:DNA-binding PadR family transcriptional regulator